MCEVLGFADLCRRCSRMCMRKRSRLHSQDVSLPSQILDLPFAYMPQSQLPNATAAEVTRCECPESLCSLHSNTVDVAEEIRGAILLTIC